MDGCLVQKKQGAVRRGKKRRPVGEGAQGYQEQQSVCWTTFYAVNR
jgi:hypothetical protein